MRIPHAIAKILETIVGPVISGVVVALMVVVLSPVIVARIQAASCDDPKQLQLETGVAATGAAKATDYFPHKGAVDYSATNLTDGRSSTAWVEGLPGLGLGASVTLTLRKPSDVRLICLVDGYAESWPLYEKNSRVRLLQVHTDAGTRASLLRDAGSPEHPAVYQQLNAPRGRTSTVTLTILSAYSAQLDAATGQRGYADTSISEIEVWSSS